MCLWPRLLTSWPDKGGGSAWAASRQREEDACVGRAWANVWCFAQEDGASVARSRRPGAGEPLDFRQP